MRHGVKTFRVDNPHTKPLPFWEWMIAEVRAQHPDVLFLSEAFTRPNMMYRLAKVGFNQSYTYFTWRDFKAELTGYITELTTEAPKDFYRPHFFVNTPTSTRTSCRLADGPRTASARYWQRRFRGSGASILASNCAMPRHWALARKSISIPKNTRFGCATGTSRAISSPT